jgi:hypothetical protein
MNPSTILARATSALFVLTGTTLVACGAGDGSQEPQGKTQGSLILLPQPPRLVGDPAHGIFASASCDVATITWCAGATYDCALPCIDSSSWECHTCIDQDFTGGIDCWTCLFGGGGDGVGGSPAPQSSYFACEWFPGDPDATGTPRIHDPQSKTQESCAPSQYDWNARSWRRECCLYPAYGP